MVFMISMKGLLKRVGKDIIKSVYRSFMKILGYVVVILVIGLAARSCAKAMTVQDNLRTIGDTQFKLLENIYERSDYDNYLITSNYNKSSYNNTTNYYLCLTNEKINTNDVKNATSSCSELYHYNAYSNNYVLEKLNDNQLKVVNSVYYTNTIHSKPFYYNVIILLIIIVILCSISWLFSVFSKVFKL